METMTEVAAFLRQFWGLWLMIFFLGIIVWAYRPRNKDRFEDDAMIPLRDDENEERKDGGNS
ncbi:MAG: cbb3-type cytochrome c oxidase subunit 3 [Rhodospirillaceae bacterium]